jgi:3-oxoacyl-(acyl-carrier-protein) synthase
LHLAQTEGQDGFMLGQTAQMHFLIETEHMRNP